MSAVWWLPFRRCCCCVEQAWLFAVKRWCAVWSLRLLLAVWSFPNGSRSVFGDLFIADAGVVKDRLVEQSRGIPPPVKTSLGQNRNGCIRAPVAAALIVVGRSRGRSPSIPYVLRIYRLWTTKIRCGIECCASTVQ